MVLSDWSNFCLGELGAAAALAGLLFVSVSVNQARILALGRMADRGIEALAMLLLVLLVASLPLVPGQSLRGLGAQIFGAGTVALLALVPVQRSYFRDIAPPHRRRSRQLIWVNRLALALIAAAGGMLLCQGSATGLYLLPPGILLTFAAVGINAWVLLIEINR